MVGIVDAMMQWLLQGTRHRPDKAKELGFIDELVTTPEELVPAAKAWINAQGEDFAGQKWDQKGYKIPGGTPATPKLAMNLPAFPANLRKQLKGATYPAPHHIMPRPWRAPRSMWTPRWRSRVATSSTWPPVRSPRT